MQISDEPRFLYVDGSDLYIASTICKHDDIAELKSMLPNGMPRNVLDIGGGFGRLALHFTASEEWLILDRSQPLIEYGKVLHARHGIDNVKFQYGEASQARFSKKYELIICSYNTINEFDTLDILIDTCRAGAADGGRLFIKAIHREDQSIVLRTFVSIFRGFDNLVWKCTAMSTMTNHREQELCNEFRTVSGNHQRSFVVRRTIWPLAEIDAAVSKAGFELECVGREQGYRLYRKRSQAGDGSNVT